MKETPMQPALDTRRITIFLIFAFGIAWATGLIIYLTGGLVESPALIETPILRLNLATVLMATTYMFAPALAVVATRLVTREGWGNAWLRPHFRQGWRIWAVAWVSPAILTIVGGAIYFSLFPQHFDAQMSALQSILDAQLSQLGEAGTELPFPLWVVALLQIVQAMVLAPLINSLFTFGEEWGWRGYLQPKLMGLGWRKAMIAMGIIWGVWHWPLLLMGYNYGVDYPGAPWLGPLVFLWFTFLVGTFLGWLAAKGRSVWPAVIAHAGINGIAVLPSLFVQGDPNLLLGPLPVGLIGSLGFFIVALWMFMTEPKHSEEW